MIPGSALRKLKAMTGLETSHPSDKVYKLHYDGGEFSVEYRDEKRAADRLRQLNWTRVCCIAFELANYKCIGCGQIKPLQGHHKLYRSRWKRSDGPLDVVSNIASLCNACHQSIHEPKRL